MVGRTNNNQLFNMSNDRIRLFEGFKIRYSWEEEFGEWFFSAVDVCNALAESTSKDPGAYWRKLKQRLIAEGSEVVTNCHGLKLQSSDGKKYKTDCFTTKDTLRLIQSIPSPKAEPFKLWLAQVGSDRLDEIADPEKAILRGAEERESPRQYDQFRIGLEYARGSIHNISVPKQKACDI